MNIVKKLVDSKGISQKELAIIIGVSQPTVSDWCSNKKDPRGKNLDLLSKTFGVPKSTILGYDELPTEKPFVSDEDIRFALSGGEEPISKAQFEEVKQFVRFIRERDKSNGNK